MVHYIQQAIQPFAHMCAKIECGQWREGPFLLSCHVHVSSDHIPYILLSSRISEKFPLTQCHLVPWCSKPSSLVDSKEVYYQNMLYDNTS